MKTFAIVLVCYNRLNDLKRLLSSLERCNYGGRKDITLIFSIDYSGSNCINEFANNYTWPYGKKIIRSYKEKQGLKNHVLSCGDYAFEYDIIAVLEDDTYLSDSFFFYAYWSAVFYYNDDRIGGISLYSYQKNWIDWIYRFEPQKSKSDVFFMRIAQSWGQVWTTRQWNSFKLWYANNSVFPNDESIPSHLLQWPETSWLKFYCLYLIKTNKFFVYPQVSLSTNFSSAGTHNNNSCSDYQVELAFHKYDWEFEEFCPESSIVYDEFMCRMNLEKALNIRSNDFTNDIYGTKNKNEYRRFVLSTKHLNYRIIDSFGLYLRPIELNVINSLHGNDIFLYDTLEKRNNKKTFISNKEKLFVYFSRSNNAKLMLSLLKKVRLNQIKQRIKRIFKRPI